MEQPVFRFLSHTQAIVSISFGEQGERGGGSRILEARARGS